jgi:hypothetical protein
MQTVFQAPRTKNLMPITPCSKLSARPAHFLLNGYWTCYMLMPDKEWHTFYDEVLDQTLVCSARRHCS